MQNWKDEMAADQTQVDLETKCRRKVERNKYETNSPESRSWWNELFKILEADASIPPDKRIDVLKEVLPERVLNQVISILGCESKRYTEPLEDESEKMSITIKKEKLGSMASLVPDSARTVWNVEEIRQNADDLRSRSSSSAFEQFGAKPTEKPNPYLNFFKRRPGREAIWRELPPLTLEDMNLSQKAAYITEAIARNFVDWIKTLGGDEDSYLTVEGVVEMFEIGYPINSAKSLKVELKNMPSVPAQVAQAAMNPELATRLRLHQEIMKDKFASRKTPHITAFGRRLPPEMQLKPPNKKEFKNWLHCNVPERLQSMAEVWQGITHLKSTKAFCEYLVYEKPEVTPPPYLVNIGMMNIETMSHKRDSNADDDNFGNIRHLTNM